MIITVCQEDVDSLPKRSVNSSIEKRIEGRVMWVTLWKSKKWTKFRPAACRTKSLMECCRRVQKSRSPFPYRICYAGRIFPTWLRVAILWACLRVLPGICVFEYPPSVRCSIRLDGGTSLQGQYSYPCQRPSKTAQLMILINNAQSHATDSNLWNTIKINSRKVKPNTSSILRESEM